MVGALGRVLGGVALAAALVGCAVSPEPGDGPAGRSPQAARLRAQSGPVQLVGLKADAVDALLGAPELARRERQAQYRRYEIEGCAVDLYLYDDRSNGAPKVAWFEVRPVDPLVTLDARACGWLQERLGVPPDGERQASDAVS